MIVWIRSFLFPSRYIYCDDVQFDSNNLVKIYYAAKKYDLQRLLTITADQVGEKLYKTNFLNG